MLYRGFIFLFFLTSIFLAGCGGDKYGEQDNPYKACSKVREKSFEDQAGDTEKKFLDLTSLKVIIGADCVGADIELAELPPTLTFNHSGLGDGEMNYEWSVYFDIDGGDSISEGDLALSITHHKPRGSEEREDDVLSPPLYSLWKINHDNSKGFVSHIYADVSGNTLSLAANTSNSSEVSRILYSTKVKFVAAHNDGINPYRDVYPDSDLFE